jgi:hypothetical protein
MRALADAIARFYAACAGVRGRLCPEHMLELDHIDTVANALDEALVAIRTIDLEVLDASDTAAYLALRKSSAHGSVVRAFTAPRNSAVHSAEVIDPDIARAIGPLDDGRCLIFPRWKPRSSLPPAMFQYPKGKKKGQEIVDLTASYDASAAGRLVLDTLMDAFAFIDSCDPRLADRDNEGHVRGFPLAPLPVPGYVRLAPDWPDQETVDQNIRGRARAERPSGEGREISGVVSATPVPVYCGYTTVDARRRHAFTEPADQVQRDIALGYEYVVAHEGRRLALTVVGDQLQADGLLIDKLELPDWTDSTDPPWSGWWELCESDAAYYRSQRNAS